MRVVRSRTFETAKGLWEKIEVEMDSTDLLPEELATATHVHPQLLENRIDKQLILTLLQHEQITQAEATQKVRELDATRASLLRIGPKKTLKQRGLRDV